MATPLALLLGSASFSSAEQGTVVPAVTPPVKPAAAVVVPPPPPAPRSVSWLHPRSAVWPDLIRASGNVMPWQETRIGSEVGGLRLSSVLVTVGDQVKKGQVLARLDAATVETDIDAAKAQVAEAEATLAQATATLERGKRLAPSGGVSQQELTLYETQKHTAEARVNAARAQEKRQQLRLQYATLVAPDDGLISASFAAEGTIVQAGSELFRLIRQGRLEWRAEVKGELLGKLARGQDVTVESPLGPDVKGRIRLVSPTIDLASRNGLVYVDLPVDTDLKAGLNVSGSILLGRRKVLAVPVAAVLRQKGSARVLVVDADNRIQSIDVSLGRTKDDWVEITAGVDEHSRVVSRPQGELHVGDVVKPVSDDQA
ncbi:efflux RND transporter periplasmic adaptor subunit [Zoogloea sp. LCSB751]|uniref:efflux RND transporter periplasmic adaptor subunit n=1 Tax=Zoogloea sp. LCSB751 TaxID=1965277 RepID=UPI001374806E|nr:efflux RND transporter periplasmic adaptor subunit [Zoogloea sp. LCSB751]